MRKKERIKPFLEEIEKIWYEIPDWRFGQILSNVFGETDLFYLEEEQFLNEIKKYFKKDEISKEQAYKNLKEIIELCEDDEKNIINNVSAVLDDEDIKSLKIILDSIENK